MHLRNSRTAQLIFQTAYCTLGIIAVIASTGLFAYDYQECFYVYFTNLSNYICVAIMFMELIQTVRKREDGPVTFSPVLKYAGIMGILLTFLLFNLLLAGQESRDPAANFTIFSVLCHVVLPPLYILDWFLFYERRHVKWFYPFLGMIYPALYLVFIYLRAWIVNFDPSVPLLYPYFFLDPIKQGVPGLVMWFFILFGYFVGVGFLLFGIDVLARKRAARKAGK